MKSFVFQGAVTALSLRFAFAQDSSYPDYCALKTCQSFGIDFQDGGSYFQNIKSTSPFTALESFSGCQNDTNYNVLVDPDGYQTECSMTNLQPDGTPELTTCGLNKNQLYSGDWSLLVYSNNGECEPMAFERDFVLTVATQATITVTPTVIVTNIYTPVTAITSTLTVKVSSTAPAKTTTVASSVKTQTVSVRSTSVTTVTKALVTVIATVQSAVVVTSTKTATATCSKQSTSKQSDTSASLTITIGGAAAMKERAATAEPTGALWSAKFKRAIIEGRDINDELRKQFVQDRHHRLNSVRIGRRAPDDPTYTSTAATASLTTYTSTAPTITVYGTVTSYTTLIVTPTLTVRSGVSAAVVTTTLAPTTITNVLIVPALTSSKTVLATKTVTVASTTTPAAMAASCALAGGVMV